MNASVFKTAYIFTGFMLVVNLVIDLMSTHFKASLLTSLFSWQYWVYDVLPELLISFLAAAGTIMISSKLKDFTWKSVILKVVIFTLIYSFLCLMISFTVFMVVNGSNFKLYNPWDFIFSITGIRVAFIFQVVWMVLKYQQKPLDNE